MTITTTTHLNFPGTARRALEFYRSVFGGEVTLATYGDLGMPEGTPGADRIVFGRLDGDGGFGLMAYDVPGAEGPGPRSTTRRQNGMTLTDSAFFQSVRAESLDELTRYWDRLADEAEIIEPLAASPWSPGFGMLADRFGVTWVLDVQAAGAAG